MSSSTDARETPTAGPDDLTGVDLAGPGLRGPDLAGADLAGVDLGRRRFFRGIASGALDTVATLAGAAGMLQNEAVAARDDLLRGDAALARPPAGAGRAGSAALPGSGRDPWAGAVVAVNDPNGTFRSPYRWDGGRLLLVDQRRLPDELVEVECRSGAEVAAAIRDMVIRGAPAIGQAAAYGLARTAAHLRETGESGRDATIRGTADLLRRSRRTTASLGWAMDRMLARYEAIGRDAASAEVVADALLAEADAIATEAMLQHAELARHGAELLATAEGEAHTGRREILTHGDTGPLGAGQVGTALGVIQRLHGDGQAVHVWVDEGRPVLQGARLTAWELTRAGVPHTVIVDGAAGSLMAQGRIDAILVGADCVAANGDTANQIGTYPLAVLAAHHAIPFFVCAPSACIDLDTLDGAAIALEDRPAGEVTTMRGGRITPVESPALNPAFDVTPAELIGAIVTERGIIRSPYDVGLAEAVVRPIRPTRTEEGA